MLYLSYFVLLTPVRYYYSTFVCVFCPVFPICHCREECYNRGHIPPHLSFVLRHFINVKFSISAALFQPGTPPVLTASNSNRYLAFGRTAAISHGTKTSSQQGKSTNLRGGTRLQPEDAMCTGQVFTCDLFSPSRWGALGYIL